MASPRWPHAAADSTRRLVLLGLAGLVACGAMGEDAPAPVLPTIPLQVGAEALTAEVADTPALRERGLMERRALRRDHGMVFVYPDTKVRSFWMKNTPLLLSIAFIDEQGEIVRIADMQPYDTSPVSSQQPAMYALEVTQGWFGEHGVTVGTKVGGLPGPSKE